MKWHYTIIGFGLDVFDWLLVGLIPLLGDVVDVVATAFWLKKLGALGLVELIELVPGADLLPTNLALGFLVDRGGKIW